jgi:hypothetical protein
VHDSIDGIKNQLKGSSLMQKYLSPIQDMAFKRLFNDKGRLMDFLNNLLELHEHDAIIDVEYVPTEQISLHKQGKESIFDIKVCEREILYCGNATKIGP